MSDSILWYIRKRGSTGNGPFSISMISNQLSLHRLNSNDEASKDNINWHPISHWPEFKAGHSEHASKQLDERNGFDRRNDQLADQKSTQRNTNDRRVIESDEAIHRRQFRTQIMQKFRQRKQALFWPISAVVSFSLIVVWLGVFHAEPLPSSLSTCDKPAAPHINWENCIKPKSQLENSDLSHAQLRNSQLPASNLMHVILNNANLAYAGLRASNLSYSQIQNANLKGANLKNADLSYSDLTNSDLSYADLNQANLGGSKLDNVRFDHAIWIDGKKCLPNSIGKCNILAVNAKSAVLLK